MPPVGAASSRRPCPRHASGRIAERLVVLSCCRLVAAVCVLRSRAQGREKWGFWWFPIPLYTYIASLLKKKHSRKHSADTSKNKQTNKTTTMTTTPHPPPPCSLLCRISQGVISRRSGLSLERALSCIAARVCIRVLRLRALPADEFEARPDLVLPGGGKRWVRFLVRALRRHLLQNVVCWS